MAILSAMPLGAWRCAAMAAVRVSGGPAPGALWLLPARRVGCGGGGQTLVTHPKNVFRSQKVLYFSSFQSSPQRRRKNQLHIHYIMPSAFANVEVAISTCPSRPNIVPINSMDHRTLPHVLRDSLQNNFAILIILGLAIIQICLDARARLHPSSLLISEDLENVTYI